MTFEPYVGKALDNIDDTSSPVVFVVKRHDGAAHEFPAIMHYYQPDKVWVLNDLLPIAFMDEFAHGGLLNIRNAKGGMVIEVGTTGAEKACEIVRRICGM